MSEVLSKVLMCVVNEEIPADPPMYLFSSRIDTMDEEGNESFMNDRYLRDFLPPGEDKDDCLIMITLSSGYVVMRTSENFSGGRCDCCCDPGCLDEPVVRVRVFRIFEEPTK